MVKTIKKLYEKIMKENLGRVMPYTKEGVADELFGWFEDLYVSKTNQTPIISKDLVLSNVVEGKNSISVNLDKITRKAPENVWRGADDMGFDDFDWKVNNDAILMSMKDMFVNVERNGNELIVTKFNKYSAVISVDGYAVKVKVCNSKDEANKALAEMKRAMTFEVVEGTQMWNEPVGQTEEK